MNNIGIKENDFENILSIIESNILTKFCFSLDLNTPYNYKYSLNYELLLKLINVLKSNQSLIYLDISGRFNSEKFIQNELYSIFSKNITLINFYNHQYKFNNEFYPFINEKLINKYKIYAPFLQIYNGKQLLVKFPTKCDFVNFELFDFIFLIKV
jgi:hypothetical protein